MLPYSNSYIISSFELEHGLVSHITQPFAHASLTGDVVLQNRATLTCMRDSTIAAVELVLCWAGDFEKAEATNVAQENAVMTDPFAAAGR